MARILVADDEEGVRWFLAESLERDGHEVVAVGDGAAAIAAIREGGYDAVLTDLRMPGADGMEVVRVARTEQPDVEVIVLTAFGAVSTAVLAMKLGAFDYLEKPAESPAAVRALVGRALARRAAIAAGGGAAIDPPKDGLRLTWGAPAMAPVDEAHAKAATSAATVRVLRESRK
jgi:DNA-binding NtrC family response regulator